MAAAVPSPAKLSSLSTSLLSSLVELSRLQSLSAPQPPSSRAAVLKNLTALRSGILALEQRDGRGNEVVGGLRAQYGRLLGLIRGLGDMGREVAGMELPEELQGEAGANELLGDDGDDDGGNTPTAASFIRFSAAVPPKTGNLLDGMPPPPREEAMVDMSRVSGERSRREWEEDEAEVRSQNEDVQLMQRAMMDDQDRSLDALSMAIRRQRDLSMHISSELDTQEALLEDLDEGFDRTGARLGRAGRRLDTFATKARENGAMCTIIGLIVILLILIILFK